MDPKSNGTQSGESSKDGVSGEGNYEATRRYNRGLEESVQKGNAEEQGKQGAHKSVPK